MMTINKTKERHSRSSNRESDLTTRAGCSKIGTGVESDMIASGCVSCTKKICKKIKKKLKMLLKFVTKIVQKNHG